LTPEETDVKVSFRKDKKEILTKHILFPAYTSILQEFKKILGMPAEKLESEAEAKVLYSLDETPYEMLGKIVPGSNGEKIFIKLKKTQIKEKKEKKKVNFASILSFLLATIFVALVMG